MAYFAYMRISTKEERAKQKYKKAGKDDDLSSFFAPSKTTFMPTSRCR